MRFLFYSHDAMGLGHVRRHLAIASSLVQASSSAKVLLATSVDEASQLGLPPNVDTLKLPGLRKISNNRYTSRRLGLPPSEIRALRSALLLEAVKSFRPAVVLVDKHPFGAGGEFRAALEAVKSSGARAVLGLRDILDSPAAVLKEWSPEDLPQRVSDYYDLVLVYGVHSIFDPIEQYQFPPALAARTKYCGYVVNPSPPAEPPDQSPLAMSPPTGARPTVLATTGGGEDGFRLLKTFIEAAAGAPWNGLAVAGTMLSEQELKTLQQLAGANNIPLHTFLPSLYNLLQKVEGLVCMGGYNTLLEAASQGVPTVCVPRTSPRSEQLLRSQAFEALGLLRTIHPQHLTVERLRQEISSALQLPREEMRERAHDALNFQGARRAADYLLELVPCVRRDHQGKSVQVVS